MPSKTELSISILWPTSIYIILLLRITHAFLMSQQVQYVTNPAGERLGVLLDLETYQNLVNLVPNDEEILTGMSVEELQALAESELSIKAQNKLNDLLVRNKENELSLEETTSLDNLLVQIDQLNIIKTRARYTLHKLQNKIKAS
ncbi:hypothetical protein CAL7102_03334 [Dulcicalothrix desertica PCC 7102]|nr:hypothetical protein CAL7102_03334 [Dulcicalothrix desertica PCC 7102]